MNNKQRGWPEGCGGLYWEEMGMMDEIRRVPILGADGMEAMNRETD